MPHTFGCPPYVWTPKYDWMHPVCLDDPLYVWMAPYVWTPHMFGCSPICLDTPCMLGCSPYVWTPPVCLDVPICLDKPYMFGLPLYVWLCLDAPKMYGGIKRKGVFKHTGHPNVLRCPNIQGGVQTYGKHPNVQREHPNI